jgi:hypothetical protein
MVVVVVVVVMPTTTMNAFKCRILAIEAEACGAQYDPNHRLRRCQTVTLSNMYVCSVQGAAHTLKSGVFERDADADEAALTGAVTIIIAMLLLLLLLMMMMLMMMMP